MVSPDKNIPPKNADIKDISNHADAESSKSFTTDSQSFLRTSAKLIIYSTLVLSFLFFIFEDYQTSSVTHRDGITFYNIASAFAASIDSFAWLVLLAVFEAETWILDDNTLRDQRIKWLLGLTTALAYIIVFIAFLGYVEMAFFVGEYEKVPRDICMLVDIRDLSIAAGLDAYSALDAAACNALPVTDAGFLWHPDAGILASASVYADMSRLVWTDVVNSLCWLLLVILLQAEVWLQVKSEKATHLSRLNQFLKAVLYVALTVCCFYWLYFGALMDFLDALFWLLAFFLIEVNLIAWAEEKSISKLRKKQAS